MKKMNGDILFVKRATIWFVVIKDGYDFVFMKDIGLKNPRFVL